MASICSKSSEEAGKVFTHRVLILVYPEQMRIHVEKLEYAAVWSSIFILDMPFQLKKKSSGKSND